MNALRNPRVLAGLALVAVAGVWYLSRRGMAGTGQGIGASAVQFVDGVASGAVQGLGQLVGIPATNPTKCQADQAAGRWWDASFSCPAGTFIATGAPIAAQAAQSASVDAVPRLGSMLGIPRTSQTQCEIDQAAGRWWDASFSCPAGDFIGGLVGGGSKGTAHMELWGAEARLNREPVRTGGASGSW